jgi:catechol 2,3-dioxygenase-like lactoylglutathione lyase family enzyme
MRRGCPNSSADQPPHDVGFYDLGVYPRWKANLSSNWDGYTALSGSATRSASSVRTRHLRRAARRCSSRCGCLRQGARAFQRTRDLLLAARAAIEKPSHIRSHALVSYADHVRVSAIDHVVLCVRDVAVTRNFYERVLGMESREERPGKWSLHFGVNKISLQDARTAPSIARDTVPGSGNFCVLTDVSMDEVVAHLGREGVAVVDGPGERAGARGSILSVYFKDPDGNLVEVSNQL